MLIHSINRCIRNFTLTCLCVIAITAHAAPSKPAPVDLSILEDRNELSTYMDAAQKITLLQLEKKVEQAESNLHSAEYLMQSKITAFKDADDVKKDNERGKEQIKISTVDLYEAQVELVNLLNKLDTKRSEQRLLSAQKYNFSLETKPYEIALIDTADSLFKVARNKGYQKVFFDSVSITDAKGTKQVTTDARNATYDTLVEVDGTNFTVGIPIGLKLDNSGKLTLDNLEDYKNDALALLAIELIQPAESEDALLYMRLLDLYTCQIIDHALLRVTGTDVLFNQSATSDVADSEASAPIEAVITDIEVTSKPFPIGANISDDDEWIEKLTQQTYRFTVLASGDNSQIHAAFLTHSLLKNTTLSVIDDAYVARVYGSKDTQFIDMLDAQFNLIKDEDSYQIKANSYSSDRVIDIGSMALVYE